MNGKHSRNASAAVNLRASCGAAVITLLLLGGPATAGAGDWNWTLTPYVWATGVGIDARLDDRQILDEQVSVSDLLEDLDTIFQVRIEGQRGAHGVMLDLFDVTLSDGVSGVAMPHGAGETALRADIGMTILDLGGVYDPKGDRLGLSVLYGLRIIDERATVDATFAMTSGPEAEGSYDTNDILVDALAGLRFNRPLTRRLSYQMQADVSTGGTAYTWSASPSLSYAFGAKGRHALAAGYRSMTIDFLDDEALDSRLTLSGLLVSIRTSF